MEFLIRFAQVHETFRRPEIQALATLAGINVEFLFYDQYVCSMFSLMKKKMKLIPCLYIFFIFVSSSSSLAIPLSTPYTFPFVVSPCC